MSIHDAHALQEQLLRDMSQTVVKIAPGVTDVLVDQLKACRDFIVALPSTHKSWRTCVCENCPKIRKLMGTHCACEEPSAALVTLDLPLTPHCKACGLPFHP